MKIIAKYYTQSFSYKLSHPIAIENRGDFSAVLEGDFPYCGSTWRFSRRFSTRYNSETQSIKRGRAAHILPSWPGISS